MNRSLALLIALSCFAACFLPPARAQAQALDGTTRSTARQLGQEGVQAYQAGDYALASERLERAYQLLRAPSLAFWSARALEKLGKLVQASERYLEATRLGVEDTSQAAVQEKAKLDAQAAHDALTPRIPRVTLLLHGATPGDIVLSIDGAPMSSALLQTTVPMDPGTHEVVAQRGRHTARARLSLTEGSTTKVNLRFQGASATAEVSAGTAGKGDGKPSLVGPVILLASGTVLAVTGIVLIAGSQDCYYDLCVSKPDQATGGAVLTAVGVAAAAGGGVWLGITLSQRKRASAGLTLQPVRAGVGFALAGTF